MVNEITIFQGDTKSITITITNDDGDAIDLTSYDTITFMAKSELSLLDNEAEIDKAGSSGVDPTLGVITVDLTSTDTDIEIRDYFYGVEIRNTNTTPDTVHTVVRSTLTIKADVRSG